MEPFAAAGSAADTLSVTVVRGPLKRVGITPAEVVLKPGEQITFQAQGYDIYNNAFKVNPFWYATRDIGTIGTYTGVFVAGDTPGTGDIVAFAWGIFGETGTDVTGSAKATIVSAHPLAYRLVQNTPNPFNASTAISYQLSADSYVSLRVYDTAGRLVATLVDGWRSAGTHELTWEAGDLPSGMYFARLEAGDYVGVQKLILVK